MKAHEWFVEHRLEYATRALDPDDARTFEAHLPRCEECRAEVARAEADLAWLPMAARPAAPRPGLRRRIVQEVLDPHVSRRARWPVPAAAAAALLLAAGGWYAGQAGSRGLESALAVQRARAAALEDTLSVIRRAGRVLHAELAMGEARGSMVIFADEVSHRWSVVVQGLPPAPGGGRYQFWFVCSDGMVRGAEVPASESGPILFTTGMPERGGEVMGAALTVEPPDAGAEPQGKKLAELML